MKILIIKYDNGYAVTVTDKVLDAQGLSVDRQVKLVFENRDALFALLQEKL